jgi:hypothetical protein
VFAVDSLTNAGLLSQFVSMDMLPLSFSPPVNRNALTAFRVARSFSASYWWSYGFTC